MVVTPATGDLWTESLAGHKMDRANRIALAALEIVSSSGMSGLTMSAIAKRAGISRQTLYRYFPDAERVLAAAVGMAAEVEQHIERQLAVGHPIERLNNFVTMTLQGAAAGHPSPLTYLYSLPPEARMRARRHADHVQALVQAIIADGVADGSFTPALDPAIDGALIYRLVIGSHDLAAIDDDPQDLIDHVLRVTDRLVRRG